MNITVAETKQACGQRAAQYAARTLRALLDEKETVRFIAATGASQFDFLEALVAAPGIDWHRTEMFHLDEYVGIDVSHGASFVRYLQERLTSRVPIKEAVFINGAAADPEKERARVSQRIAEGPIDLAFVGIGENGHLAFNDPPARFDATDPYLILELDEACRLQQVGEGWFNGLEDVPARAFTMSISQIMQSAHIVCTVPDARKAQAVSQCLSANQPITPDNPASILRQHQHCEVFLDLESAALLQAR